MNAGGEAAERRSASENRNSDQKHTAPAKEVAHGPAHQNQRGESQSVGFDNPLHLDDVRSKARL